MHWIRDAVRISETWQSIRREQDIHQQAFMALHLTKSLGISVNELVTNPQETLIGLLKWASQFSESQHGPIWLKAFEGSRIIKDFLPGFSPNLEKLGKLDESAVNTRRITSVGSREFSVLMFDRKVSVDISKKWVAMKHLGLLDFLAFPFPTKDLEANWKPINVQYSSNQNM